MNTKVEYKQLWIATVDIEAVCGFDFMELIDFNKNQEETPKYIGAWANIIIHAVTIDKALTLLEMGLSEKNFKIKFVDKIENMSSLVENGELNVDMIKEAEWLYCSPYKFIISDKLWPYVED